MATSDFPLTDESARWQDPSSIDQLLESARTIAIVGCLRLIPQGQPPRGRLPQERRLLRHSGGTARRHHSRRARAAQPQAAIGSAVDIVDCFRPSAELAGIVADAIANKAKAVCSN
ncbi:MAG: hypothetical protein U5N10_13725 [Gemmobacter sp.]|nr:hypothetical protein [Gemmobacter sp.]